MDQKSKFPTQAERDEGPAIVVGFVLLLGGLLTLCGIGCFWAIENWGVWPTVSCAAVVCFVIGLMILCCTGD